jgi:large conductance mechanosensitive channel
LAAAPAILGRAISRTGQPLPEEKTMGFATEFKEFASKGNVVDLAVGVIIGAAFAKIVDSMVKDLIMPVVGRIFGGLDFSNYFLVLAPPPPNYAGPMTYEALSKAGVPLFAYGNFLTVLLNFLILAFIIFVMVKQINRLRRTVPPVAATPEDVVLLREIRDSLRR